MQNLKKISIIFALSVCSATMIAKKQKPAQPVATFLTPINIMIQNSSKDPLIVQEKISGGTGCKWLPKETLATIAAGASNSITVKIPQARAAKLLFKRKGQQETRLKVVTVAENPQGVTLVKDGSSYTYSQQRTITQTVPTNPPSTQTGK
jgi:hypothetical protein